ncbi:hypothetical protein OH77DRAFT_653446 [Trametes cingulata]|nr:hypothetical protein OH77DRAFT_653446 [Trametes cingulata]
MASSTARMYSHGSVASSTRTTTQRRYVRFADGSRLAQHLDFCALALATTTRARNAWRGTTLGLCLLGASAATTMRLATVRPTPRSDTAFSISGSELSNSSFGRGSQPLADCGVVTMGDNPPHTLKAQQHAAARMHWRSVPDYCCAEGRRSPSGLGCSQYSLQSLDIAPIITLR